MLYPVNCVVRGNQLLLYAELRSGRLQKYHHQHRFFCGSIGAGNQPEESGLLRFSKGYRRKEVSVFYSAVTDCICQFMERN